MDVNVQSSVTISADVKGSIFPPKITHFGIRFGFNGHAGAIVSISGDLSGHVSPPDVTLFKAHLPGISIPAILKIGPQFALLGQIEADFGLQHANAVVGVDYDLSGASFIFPPQAGSSTNGITSSSTQVEFKADPNFGETLNATAFLIPRLSLGLDALGGIVSASVFLDVEASIDLLGSISSATDPHPCLSGNPGIDVGVGAEGSFFGLFKPSARESLFKKNYPPFQQCFV